MRQLLILTAFVLGLTLTAVAPGSFTVGQGLAYEFSEAERALADNPTLSPPPSSQPQQWQRDQQQAERQSEVNGQLHNQVPQFNPREYAPSMPFSYFDRDGRAQVCRRGANGVYCN
jgi:hypothetical protein